MKSQSPNNQNKQNSEEFAQDPNQIKTKKKLVAKIKIPKFNNLYGWFDFFFFIEKTNMEKSHVH